MEENLQIFNRSVGEGPTYVCTLPTIVVQTECYECSKHGNEEAWYNIINWTMLY